MIRRFVQQQNVRPLNQCFDDCEPFLPAARQSDRLCIDVFKTRTAQSLSETRAPLRLRYCGSFHRALGNGADGFARFECRVLLDVAEADSFSGRDLPAVGVHIARQNPQ